MGLTRGVSAGLVTALGGHFHPVRLIEADYPGGMIRVHTGVGNLSWNTHTWTGLGHFVRFEGPVEMGGGVAADVGSIRLAATVDGILAERGKTIRGRLVTVYLGAVTKPAGNVLVDGTFNAFSGYFDGRSFSLRKGGEGNFTHDLVLSLGNGPGARSRVEVTHSYEDQIAKYSDDTGFRHVQIALRKAQNPDPWPRP